MKSKDTPIVYTHNFQVNTPQRTDTYALFKFAPILPSFSEEMHLNNTYVYPSLQQGHVSLMLDWHV